MSETRPKIEPALLEIGEAARYLRCSRSYFDEHIRPFVPMIDIRAPGAKLPMIRFAKVDLDAYIDSRRKAVA